MKSFGCITVTDEMMQNQMKYATTDFYEAIEMANGLQYQLEWERQEKLGIDTTADRELKIQEREQNRQQRASILKKQEQKERYKAKRRLALYQKSMDKLAKKQDTRKKKEQQLLKKK